MTKTGPVLSLPVGRFLCSKKQQVAKVADVKNLRQKKLRKLLTEASLPVCRWVSAHSAHWHIGLTCHLPHPYKGGKVANWRGRLAEITEVTR